MRISDRLQRIEDKIAQKIPKKIIVIDEHDPIPDAKYDLLVRIVSEPLPKFSST